jgi:hypothetical protein
VIFQFTNPERADREVVPHFSNGCEFFDFGTLQSMVDETYAQFAAIVAARARDKVTGTRG